MNNSKTKNIKGHEGLSEGVLCDLQRVHSDGTSRQSYMFQGSRHTGKSLSYAEKFLSHTEKGFCHAEISSSHTGKSFSHIFEGLKHTGKRKKTTD